MYSTNHRNPTPPPPPSLLSSISDTSPGLVKLIASTLRYHLFSGFSASNLLVSAPPIIQITPSPPLPPLDVLSHRYSTQSTSLQLQYSRSGSSVPRRWTLSHTFFVSYYLSYPLLYCACVLNCAALFVLDMHVFAGEPIKTVNNIHMYLSTYTAHSNLIYKHSFPVDNRG